MLGKILTTLVLFCLTYSTTIGQKTDNSPYSRYGIGILNDRNFNHTRQMGGLGSSYIDGFHINTVNPASYSFLSAAAFDFGFFAKHTWLSDAKNTNKFWTGNLEYISLAFPLRNPINELYDGQKKDYKLGMAFSLMSNSSVDYNIRAKDSLTDVGVFDRNYIGSGGTYRFMWGNSIKYKNYSAGLNLSYLFGKINNEQTIIFDQNRYAFNSSKVASYTISGFSWDAGLIYSKIVNEKAIEKNKVLPAKRVSIGLNIKSANGFKTRSNIINTQVQYLSSQVFNIDTILYSPDTLGKGKLPAEIGLGMTYYLGEKTAIGFNVSHSFWAKYYNDATNEKEGGLKDATKFSIGGYYRPNYKSFDNFFERMYYRYGAYYEFDALAVNNSQIKTYGVTIGFGMPVTYQRKISNVNLGLNLGSRGDGTLIEEKFIKFSLGVTFNDDEWFLKRKYN
jgi:hypothetical protein